KSSNPKPRYYVTKPTYLFGYLRRFLPSSLLDRILAKGD
ncbi:short-chain dehydrogenase, partial [Shewanella surugensis]|nr:short-chain dehydrogenase [Shewanella surugensis]MCL1128036.1 short-chain dehydrogenase [Shewanella surugensis]